MEFGWYNMRMSSAPRLDYAPALRGDHWRIVRWIFKVAGVVALLGYVAAAFFPAYGTLSVCTRCGELVGMTEYRLPLTPIPIYRSHSRRSSALSRVVAKHGMAGNHAEQLVFVHGGGRSMFAAGCELGRSQLLMLVEDGEIANFLNDVLSYTDRDTGGAWINRLIALDSSMEFRMSLYSAGFPSGGFGNAAAFLKWWKDHAAEMVAASGG